MAGRRLGGGRDNGAFCVFEDWGSQAGGDIARAAAYIVGRARCRRDMSARVGQAMASDTGHVGVSGALGAGRVAAHVCELPCEAVWEFGAVAAGHGARESAIAAFAVCEYARNIACRGGGLF